MTFDACHSARNSISWFDPFMPVLTCALIIETPSLPSVSLVCPRLTSCAQAAASLRLAVMPNIFDAASRGNCALVRDHLAVDPSCIKHRDGRHAPMSLCQSALTRHLFCHTFRFISEHTPLHKSARYGHVDVCKILVQAGSDLQAKSIEKMYFHAVNHV
jgi:hypothetical protein